VDTVSLVLNVEILPVPIIIIIINKNIRLVQEYDAGNTKYTLQCTKNICNKKLLPKIPGKELRPSLNTRRKKNSRGNQCIDSSTEP
jgi:hypothetical protein